MFLHKIEERGLEDRFVVDSAGTGDWHNGERPDRRMIATASRHSVALPSRARQVRPADYDAFDWIICMDDSNHETLLERGAPASKVRLLLDGVPDCALLEVPDPYYGDANAFEKVFQLVDKACDHWIESLIGE